MRTIVLRRGGPGPAALVLFALAVSASGLPALAQSGNGHASKEGGADGRAVFLEGTTPGCGICHTLAAAGTSGEIGPNLDELAPARERVARAVKNGVGNMPAFDEALTQEQIDSVSEFIAKETGGTAK